MYRLNKTRSFYARNMNFSPLLMSLLDISRLKSKIFFDNYNLFPYRIDRCPNVYQLPWTPTLVWFFPLDDEQLALVQLGRHSFRHHFHRFQQYCEREREERREKKVNEHHRTGYVIESEHCSNLNDICFSFTIEWSMMKLFQRKSIAISMLREFSVQYWCHINRLLQRENNKRDHTYQRTRRALQYIIKINS